MVSAYLDWYLWYIRTYVYPLSEGRSFVHTHTHRATSVVSTYIRTYVIAVYVSQCGMIVGTPTLDHHGRSIRKTTSSHFTTILCQKSEFCHHCSRYSTHVWDPQCTVSPLTRYTTYTALTYETHSAQYLPSHGTQLIHKNCSCQSARTDKTTFARQFCQIHILHMQY